MLMTNKAPSLLIALLLLIGVLLRIVSATGDLWLDEIVSLHAVSTLGSPLEIFTRLFSDNNHLLNSLQIYLFQTLGVPAGIRILPTLASIGSLIIVWQILSERSALEQVLALSFFSFSYVLILLGSEARGYSFMLFAALAAYSLFEYSRGELPVLQKLFFWLISALGILAHYTFLQFYLSLVVYHCLLVLRRRVRMRSLFNHLVPLFFVAFLYKIHLQHLSEGSGPLLSHLQVLIDAVSIAYGGIELSTGIAPEVGLLIFVGVAFIVLLLIGGIFSLLRAGVDEWLFFLMVIFISPALGILYFEPRVIFVRYFFLSIAFSYLLFARVVTLINYRIAGRFLGLGIFAFFITGNIVHNSELMLYHRGQYTTAIEYILSRSQALGVEPTVSSDHHYRNRTLIDFFGQSPPAREPGLRYIEHPSNSNPPEWYLLHDITQDRPGSEILKLDQDLYKLQRSFLHSPLSGWSWFVYQRQLSASPEIRDDKYSGDDSLPVD